MSITKKYTHKVDDGFEQFTFKSNINPKQEHFIDRSDGEEEWRLCIVQTEESLTAKQVQELRIELTELYAFMQGLNQRDLCRRTEPGEPDQHGIGGGL